VRCYLKTRWILRIFGQDGEVITLTFRAAVGERESYDQVEVDGDPFDYAQGHPERGNESKGEPAIQSKVTDSVNGNIATCPLTPNTVRSVLEAGPGLKTMGDITLIAYFKEGAIKMLEKLTFSPKS